MELGICATAVEAVARLRCVVPHVLMISTVLRDLFKAVRVSKPPRSELKRHRDAIFLFFLRILKRLFLDERRTETRRTLTLTCPTPTGP